MLIIEYINSSGTSSIICCTSEKNTKKTAIVSFAMVISIRDAVGPNFEADIPYGIIKGN